MNLGRFFRTRFEPTGR